MALEEAGSRVSTYRMASYRKHHYVPRFYLRKFAAIGGRSIHLFTVPSGRNVLNASLRNQCYSLRFYGDSPIIEHALAGIEGAASTVFHDILTTKRLPAPGSPHHYTLMAFTMIQRRRTQMSAVTTDAMTDKMLKTAYREDPRIKDLDLDGLQLVFKDSVLLPHLGHCNGSGSPLHIADSDCLGIGGQC